MPTEEPLTEHIVKLANHGLPWFVGQGFTPFVPAGLSFHGQRRINRDNVAGEWEDTLHKEWHSETRNAEKLNCFEMLKQSLTDENKIANKKMAEVWIECASHHSRAHCGCHCAWSGQENLVDARCCSPTGSGARQAELGGWKLGLCSSWLLSAERW